MRLREHLREWAASQEEWAEMCRLQDHEFDPDSPTRFEVGARIADLLEAYADRVVRSRLVRVFAGDFYPSTLRAEAAVYRSGRDPHEEAG